MAGTAAQQPLPDQVLSPCRRGAATAKQGTKALGPGARRNGVHGCQRHADLPVTPSMCGPRPGARLGSDAGTGAAESLTTA